MATMQHVMRDDLKELSPEELYRVYMDKQVNFGMAAKAKTSAGSKTGST